ncbi:MAG: lipopolysaccharide heptosyltransferase II [Phycisphaerae bacterium]
MLDASRIVIFIPNWVGDVVMATSALRAIRRGYAAARIVHVCRPYVRDVLAGSELADEVVSWPARGSMALDRGEGILRRLRRERFDLAVLLTNSFRSALTARLAGAKRRVGYARDKRSWLLTDRLLPKREQGCYVPVPALDYYNALAVYLGCDAVETDLSLAATPSDEAVIDERLGVKDANRPWVVLNPGANFGLAKCWPPEYYAAVSDALVERYDARVVASAVPKEREIADRLAHAARRPIEIIVDPPLGLGPLKALIRRADLLITNDTGPRHFAAAFDVPVITVFGSSDPAWTDTRFARERIVRLDLDCQPCMKRVCPLKHHNCMQQLEPAQVLAMAEAFLSAAHAPAADKVTDVGL